MDYEKAYKEAYERAKKELQTCGSLECDAAKQVFRLFPELKESEDEKIRKDCISIINAWADACRLDGDCCEVAPTCIAWLEKQYYTKKDVDDAYLKGISDAKHELEKQGKQDARYRCLEELLAADDIYQMSVNDTMTNEAKEKAAKALSKLCIGKLLGFEKQGEQKPVIDFKAKDWYVSKVDGKIHDMTYNPADKVEPKFKVGDWINGYYTNYKVTAISNKGYVVEDTDGNKMNILFENEKFHNLWTIQDAKDGDVLIGSGNVKYSNGIKYERIYLFNNFDNAYFTLTKYSNHVEEYDIDVNVDYPDNTVPATKKQKEILFMAMKEAGYQWDAEKKEPKKIEQKTADKVEPKFKVGDWITNGRYNKLIVGINSDWPFYMFNDGTSKRMKDIDKKYHLWTIQDAKDGDVLADNGAKIIFIFKNIEYDSHIESNVIKYFIRYSFDGINLPLENGGHLGVVGEYSNFVPATKEQRDTLMKAMADAGWKFDFDKKELKKIEDEIEIPFGAKDSELQESTYYIPKGFHAEIDDDKVVIKKGEKSAAWSDEDEEMLKWTNGNLTDLKEQYGEKYGKVGECISWLESIKDRATWKPSEEQIHAFEQVYEWYNDNFASSETLTSLYNDLKKL